MKLYAMYTNFVTDRLKLATMPLWPGQLKRS
jgi:hypothetical protein